MKIAWLFPGQGSQEVGMGRAVAERFASARAVYAAADEAYAAEGAAPRALSELCFGGPLEELTLTENTQPAIVATSIALLAALREAHPNLPAPAVALGHSLGEYSALVSVGALELKDAIRLCRVRGRAMQRAVAPGSGAMAAVLGSDAATIASICAAACVGDEHVAVANYNAPGQTVIAGTARGVARATEELAKKSARTIPLNVSAPFHCSLMKPAAVELERELAGVSVGAFSSPVVANVDAEPNEDPARVKELLVRQVDAPVQWIKSIERAAALGVEVALEIGPGKVLAGLVKRIDKRIRVISVSDVASIEALSL
ncbi:MAG: ACP S-malonyltransferase [Polyangiaceae bacterium]